MHQTLILFTLFFLLLVVAAMFYFYKNRSFGKTAASDPITFPPAATMDSGNNSVFLKCMNLKNLYLMIGTMFWCFSIFFMIMVAAESKNQDIALPARKLIDSITSQGGWKYAPLVFLVVMLHFIYNRTKISWNNGVLIADKPADPLYFEIKKISGTITFLYLRSKDKLWILVPSTLEETKRFKNVKLLNEQLAFNEMQVQHLKHNLIQFGVQEKKHNLFTKYVIFGFAAFILSVIWIMMMFS